jgi:hypothetical protein
MIFTCAGSWAISNPFCIPFSNSPFFPFHIAVFVSSLNHRLGDVGAFDEFEVFGFGFG